MVFYTQLTSDHRAISIKARTDIADDDWTPVAWRSYNPINGSIPEPAAEVIAAVINQLKLDRSAGHAAIQ